MKICNRFICNDLICPYHYTNADEPGYYEFMDLSLDGGCLDKNIVFSPDNGVKVEFVEEISDFSSVRGRVV